MINLRDAAHKLCKQLRREGFDGVPFATARVEDDTAEEYDGERPYEEWRRDYAIFLAEPDFYSITPRMLGTTSKYVEVQVEVLEHTFRDAFVKHLRTVFGDDVKILFHCRGTEFEIIRETVPA